MGMDLEVRDPQHVCHFAPVCAFYERADWYKQEDSAGFCEHNSCIEIIMEHCVPCQYEALDDDGPGAMYCPKGCGWKEITKGGANPGYGDSIIYWADLVCGHSYFEES